MLRNPIDRVWSQIIFDLTRRNGCLRVPHAAVAGLPEQTFLSLAAFYSALNRYDFILQRWLEVYPASQIHVDFFDAVSTTPELLMRRICKFLGVPHCGVAEVGRVNAVRYDSIVMPQSVRNFLMEVYEPQLDGLNQLLQARFGLAVPAGWRTGAASGRKRVKVIGNYRGCDTWFECGSYQLMRHGASEIKSPEFWKALPMVGRNDEEVLETLMAWLCDNRRDDEGPKLMTSFRNHNLVAFRGQVYAIPHAIGVWDRWDVEDPKALPGVLVGPSMHVMKALLSEQPGLVRLPDVTIETSRR